MNTAYMIKVMQAFDDGAGIEMRSNHVCEWDSVCDPDWNWACHDFRVAHKPPVDQWINIYGKYGNSYGVKGVAEESAIDSTDFTAVHYRLVDDE